MKKMAAQVNFHMFSNAFLTSELFGARKLAHICQLKASLTYLLQQKVSGAWLVAEKTIRFPFKPLGDTFPPTFVEWQMPPH